MEKIISLFQRNYDGDRLVRDEVTPGAEWVIAGEGIATRKYDGTCCMVRGGEFFKRYEVKKGRIPPDNFEAVSPVDKKTGKQQGWIPVADGPDDKWHRKGFENMGSFVADGTYELCGPKIQGNPEGLETQVLIPHGIAEVDVPRDFEGIRDYLLDREIEGIVWHHSDGRMVKIKYRDFVRNK